MANQLQESILKAIDTLVNNRISNMSADKTVTGTIVSCTNALTNEYKVSYNGGYLTAYAQEGVSYTTNATVYVLVPEGNFTKTKYIVSKTQALEDDANISFVSSALSDYNLIGKNVIQDTLGRTPAGLFSYLKDNYLLLYQYGMEANAENKFFYIDGEELTNNLKEAEALMIEASFQTRLPKLHRLSKTGRYGLQFVLAFADRDNVEAEGSPAIKYMSYTIDNNNMTGNPYLFTSWSEQYAIYPIDTENFLYIDSIMAFANDFVEEDDYINRGMWGEDIFIKDVEIYGLKKISAVNGEYKLSLSMPQGNTFKSVLADDSLQIVGKTTKLNTNISDSTMFYWFVEDNRVTSTSEDYQFYGGAGWRYLKDKANNYTLTTYGNENRAYENKYLCVAVYKETVILKEYFTIYNDAAKRNLSITSSLGVKFSFDRGIPTLTCLIDGKDRDFEAGKVNAHADNLFRFVWSKVDEYGQTTIFNQTKEELQATYDQGIKDGLGYSELSALKSQIAAMEGVVFELGKNTLAYPVKQIDSSATFKCSVYLRDNEAADEYYIGTAEIVLQNEGVASPTDYYILIENGDQVFQYSESGVSPDDERYEDPLEIKPLTCHFYDPAGLEVNSQTYTVKWKVPLENSLIVVPKEGMVINHATGKIEWNTSEIYPTAIKSDYDYQALNNQVTAIVNYQGQEYTKDTTFLFTKVGENGTNGTDLVAKISPTSKNAILEKEMLTLELVGNTPEGWNTGQSPNEEVLTFDLYQRNEKLNISAANVTWTIAGGNTSGKSKYASASGGRFTWNAANATRAMFRNQIVRGNIKWENNDYYAFYPIPVVSYSQSVTGAGKRYHIGIDARQTLKTITYNADGRNPLYNKNQGIFITLGELATASLTNKYIVWSAEGGEPTRNGTEYLDNPTNAAFKLTYEKNSAEGQQTLLPRVDELTGWELLTQIYILPDDVYDGAYCNNLVHGRIYSSKTVYENNGNPEVEFYIPIHMSLNTFGLASLNAWDGNHVEINEDENYILAPQIGAGEKDSNNRFTGVVMGTAQTYDQSQSDIGLLGYSEGKQSIFLDARTGNAIFGLPEEQASTNNHFTEGRIELIPGGESKIGMWSIGSRALYNMTNEEGSKIEPNNPYNDYPVKNAQMSIPPHAQGVLLNANPAYISVKSVPLTAQNSNIQWNGANTTIRQGDSLEVELDPSKSSIFSIYRHTTWDGSTNTGSWRRYPLVGINQNGQFYTNAIEDGESSMGIGKVGAFHSPAADQKYIGAQFGWNKTNIFKFYVDSEENVSDQNKHLYISAGTTVDTKDAAGKVTSKGNEYARDMSLHGKTITLYAPNTGQTNEPTSDHKVFISASEMRAGHANSYVSILESTSGVSRIQLANNLLVQTDNTKDITLNSGTIAINAKTDTLNLDAKTNSTFAVGTNFTHTIGNNYSLKSKNFKISDNATNKTTTIGSIDNISYMQLRNAASTRSTLYDGYGWNITGGTGITLQSNGADGITLQATPAGGTAANGARIALTPQTGGGSDFIITSPHGTLQSKSNLGNNRAGIQITQGFSTNWGIFAGNINGTTDSIQASKDIRSSTGWVYANDFAFNKAKGYSYNGTTYSYAQISSHIERLYALLRETRDYANTRANQAQTNAQNYASNQVNNLKNSGLWASADHNHDGRYAGSNHWHQVQAGKAITRIDYDTYSSVVGDVSHIRNLYYNTSGEISTGGPM